MKHADQKIEIMLTRKEQVAIEAMSRQCKMTHSQLLRTIIFESGILSAGVGEKR